ncbi:MAG TPA: (2Fe-2S)-binding protein [Pyrinomonadaceae bacterium]|jgi:aerobic-type carbon monoxide dehydrogenase small subunit (CoxS/CutS family)
MAKYVESEGMKDKSQGFTRRGFLKGAGLSAAGAAILESGLLAAGEGATGSTAPLVVGPEAVAITLRVNGKEQKLKVEPRTTLAEALRFELGLTGTKVVCDRGSCSACTVWLDDVPVCSCMTLAVDATDRAITTIEGLAQGDTLHPVQEAFIEHDALQCGFCTPGMIMSCAALVKRNQQPTLEDVRDATSGNLCRCGTYPKVFDATLAAAKAMGRKKEGA